jgi:7-keto-8-aminopelargonate synthetase-like enzyme
MGDIEPLQQIDRTYVRQGGRRLAYIAGCDYFRLASDPRVLRGLTRTLKSAGLNVAASRLTTGHHALYDQLEAALKSYFGAEDALCVSSGYLSNLVVGQALAGEFSHAVLDARAHTSLVDAAQFIDCPILRFQHRDAADCARALERCGKGARPVVLTDGMFSHNGSVAPLPAYLKVLPRDGMLWVDDAHGAGVLGERGGGAVDYWKLPRRRIIQTITLSKAFGAYGGAILGTRELRRKVLAKSRAFIGNTPLPLPLVGAALVAIGILKRGTGLRKRLLRIAESTKSALRAAGLPLEEHPGPIIPISPTDAAAAKSLTRELLRHGVHAPFIHYPGGPQDGYFRFVISSEHTADQLRALTDAISAWCRK